MTVVWKLYCNVCTKSSTPGPATSSRTKSEVEWWRGRVWVECGIAWGNPQPPDLTYTSVFHGGYIYCYTGGVRLLWVDQTDVSANLRWGIDSACMSSFLVQHLFAYEHAWWDQQEFFSTEMNTTVVQAMVWNLATVHFPCQIDVLYWTALARSACNWTIYLYVVHGQFSLELRG